jgi:hypothetical protein
VRSLLLVASVCAACSVVAQVEVGRELARALPELPLLRWEHVSLGQAGEPFVDTDGNGHVYVTAHIYNGVSGRGAFFASADYGASFPIAHEVMSACCDFQVRTGLGDRVYVFYMTSGINGLMCAVSDDDGLSFYQNKKVLTGPYDREWFDFRDEGIDVVYSDGYIGGPVSKGVVYSRSTDFGNSFQGYVRVDDEALGTEAVDPSIICSDTTILAGWNTSDDRNNLCNMRVARSTDGGQTFTNHTTLANYDSSIGSTQERWLAQIPLLSAPNDTFLAFFQNYALVDVDGQSKKALLVFYRRSRDGGVTWEPARTVAPLSDIKEAIAQYEASKWTDDANIWPYYIQHQPWVDLDPQGNVHVVWYDNREGQNSGVINSRWRVYHTQGRYDHNGWSKPDPISPEPFLCVRPNLDFIGVAADDRYVYCAWVRRISQTSQGWSFYGDLFLSRRPISAATPVPR